MTSGNPILDKNLECIEKYNPTLKEKLLNLPYLTNKFDLIETELKEPNLTYNDLPLHNQEGAEKEAKELFERTLDNPNNTNIIFGIGLGHLFKEFCDNSPGQVVLYEPNLEILRVTLELVDFSKELSQENVKVSSDFSELKNIMNVVFRYKSEINFLFLNSYKHIYGIEINSIIKQIEIIKGTLTEQYNFLKHNGPEIISSVINNLARSLETTPLKEFKDIYKGKTAVIVSAGPSLDSNIETLKKNRDKIIIFCVGTAFKALANNDIIPDFLNIAEKSDCTGQVKGFDLSNIKLIIEPFVHESFQKLPVQKKFLFPAKVTSGGNYWGLLTGIDTSEYTAGGTVSYQALEAAKMLGFTKLILVGQDLAYLDNQCYSSLGSYSDLVFETNPETKQVEFKVKDIEKFIESCSSTNPDLSRDDAIQLAYEKIKACKDAFYYVKGINGDMLPSVSVYGIFIDTFKEFAFNNKHLQLINTSMKGAQIDGFENIPLEKALENEVLIERIELTKQFEYDKNLILENLNKEVTLLKEILKQFETIKGYCYKFEREFMHNKKNTNKSVKYYDFIFEGYNKIANDYFPKYLLYQLISLHEALELKHYEATAKEEGRDKIEKIYTLLKTYFYQVEAKMIKIIGEFEAQIEIINTTLNKTNQKEEIKT